MFLFKNYHFSATLSLMDWSLLGGCFFCAVVEMWKIASWVMQAAGTSFFESRKAATILKFSWAPCPEWWHLFPNQTLQGLHGSLHLNTLVNLMLTITMLPAGIELVLLDCACSTPDLERPSRACSSQSPWTIPWWHYWELVSCILICLLQSKNYVMMKQYN